MAREEDGDDVRRGQAAFATQQEHDVMKRQLSRASALPRPRKVHHHQGPVSGMKAFFLGRSGGRAFSCPAERAINPVLLLYGCRNGFYVREFTCSSTSRYSTSMPF